MQWKELSGGPSRTYAVVFGYGDDPVLGLQRFAQEQALRASTLTGIGAFESAVLGFFDWETKAYRRIPVREQVEVISLVGDITLDEDRREPLVHLHAVVARCNATAHGGHLLEATVRPTLEVVVTETPTHLERRHDPESGLALIKP
jgi:predicted DNA-binding protein with PD1-like motif